MASSSYINGAPEPGSPKSIEQGSDVLSQILGGITGMQREVSSAHSLIPQRG